jgi:hypothetical protein
LISGLLKFSKSLAILQACDYDRDSFTAAGKRAGDGVGNMKAVLGRAGHHLADLLGLDRMSKKYHMLVISYIFQQFYANFESVFINTLLYRISGGSMSSVIVYRCITYTATFIFFHVGAYIAQKKTPVFAARLGAFGYLSMYLILFIWMERMEQLQYLIALLAGTSGALYWAGHNTLLPHYTTRQNRDIGVAILGVVQGVMTLCIPLISGFIISLMPEISGYRVMFAFAMLAVGAQLFCMMRFYPVEQEHHHSAIRLAWKLLTRKLSYRLMMCYEFIRGIREGTFAFILNMLLFEIITEESVVGINTFFTGMMAITGSWVYGKIVAPRLRSRYALAAATVLLSACSMLLVQMSVPAVMLFTVVNAFMQLFVLNSYGNTSIDVLTHNKLARKCSAEMFAFRETAIGPGRILGLGLVLLVPPTQRGYVQAMLLLTVVQFIGIALMKLVQNQMYRKEAAGTAAARA